MRGFSSQHLKDDIQHLLYCTGPPTALLNCTEIFPDFHQELLVVMLPHVFSSPVIFHYWHRFIERHDYLILNPAPSRGGAGEEGKKAPLPQPIILPAP